MHIPTAKTFESFDTGFLKGLTDWQLRQLAAINWIDSIFNVIFIGPPGTGKTHLALAIGNKALDSGYKVFFASMDTLVHTNGVCKIEVQVYTADGNATEISGYSVGTVETGSDYPAISFEVDHNAAI